MRGQGRGKHYTDAQVRDALAAMEIKSVTVVMAEMGISRRTLQLWRSKARGPTLARVLTPKVLMPTDYGLLWGEAQALALEIAKEIMQRLRGDQDAARQAENLRAVLGGAHLGAQHNLNYTLGRGSQAPAGNVVVPIQIIVRDDSNV